MLVKEELMLPNLLVLVAALDEEEGIGPTLAELKRCLPKYALVVVDGNSRDRTVKIAKKFGANVIYQIGKGKGDALSHAIKQIRGDFDYVVLTDADYTYPADFIPEMIRLLDETPEVGMVCGNRFNSHFHLEHMGDRFYFGNRAIAFAHNLLNGVNLRDPLTGLRVVRWEIMKDWQPRSDGFDIEVELNHQVERKGFGILEIPISYRSRLGEKKLKIRDGFTILRRIMSESLY